MGKKLLQPGWLRIWERVGPFIEKSPSVIISLSRVYQKSEKMDILKEKSQNGVKGMDLSPEAARCIFLLYLRFLPGIWMNGMIEWLKEEKFSRCLRLLRIKY